MGWRSNERPAFLFPIIGFSRASPARPPSGAAVPLLAHTLEPAGDIAGLLEVFVRGAPEQHAAEYAPDRDRDIELPSQAQEIVPHARGANLRA